MWIRKCLEKPQIRSATLYCAGDPLTISCHSTLLSGKPVCSLLGAKYCIEQYQNHRLHWIMQLGLFWRVCGLLAIPVWPITYVSQGKGQYYVAINSLEIWHFRRCCTGAAAFRWRCQNPRALIFVDSAKRILGRTAIAFVNMRLTEGIPSRSRNGQSKSTGLKCIEQSRGFDVGVHFARYAGKLTHNFSLRFALCRGFVLIFLFLSERFKQPQAT